MRRTVISRTRNKSVAMSFMLMLTLGIFDAQLFALQNSTLTAGKKGEFHLKSPVRVAGTILKSGMYQVQHTDEGENHIIIFNEIKMGYRNSMGNERLGDEVARVKCRVEPANKRWRNTKIHLRKNAAGEREVDWVQVAGENVRHLF